MSLEDLFCDVDDFCRRFLPDWHRQQLQYGERKRLRGCRMVLSELITILIHFHQSHYRDFKAFYGSSVFPVVPSISWGYHAHLNKR